MTEKCEECDVLCTRCENCKFCKNCCTFGGITRDDCEHHLVEGEEECVACLQVELEDARADLRDQQDFIVNFLSDPELNFVLPEEEKNVLCGIFGVSTEPALDGVVSKKAKK